MAGCPRCLIPRTACRRCLISRESIITLSCPLRGQRECPVTMFREQVLLYCSAHSAANRDVILSRRACGASKNLLRPPQSSCSAIMPAFLYTKPYYIPARSFDFVPRFSLGTSLRMTGGSVPRQDSARAVFAFYVLQDDKAGRVKRGLLKAEFEAATPRR